ncbi:WG repeat-containing protein [Leptospira neocaledonica]|uniref:WG repeat-containing protein n=1 Tax=Leptospira neocaledonica TaxID=2023192 RepID=A0A2M9ZUP8_9LEPT|nr:WG repeat-containing protein [Leptospira neocaledonica]PJZ75744.1 hypothetical protein CH365_17200 [Leptospira neocaledonica]
MTEKNSELLSWVRSGKFKIFAAFFAVLVCLWIFFNVYGRSSNHACTTQFEPKADYQGELNYITLVPSNSKIPGIKLLGENLSFARFGPEQPAYLAFTRKFKSGLATLDGDILISKGYENFSIYPNVIVAYDRIAGDEGYGYYDIYDIAGKRIGNETYDKYTYFEAEPESLAVCKRDSWGCTWGILDLKEKKIKIPISYSGIFSYSEGILLVSSSPNNQYGFHKYHFINDKEEPLSPLSFDGFTSGFSEGHAAVEIGMKFTYIDKKGQLLSDFIYETGRKFSDGLGLVKLNGKYGFIDHEGKVKIPFQYEQAWPFSDGFAKVYRDKKPYIIDTSGKEIFQGTGIDKINNFLYEAYNSSGKKSSYIYVLNANFKPIRPFAFDRVSEQKDGNIILASLKEGTSQIISPKGEILFSSKDSLHDSFYDNGYLILKRSGSNEKNDDGKYYLINIASKTEKELPYQNIRIFTSGVFIAKEGEKEIYVDTEGNRISGNFTADELQPFVNGIAIVMVNGKYGFIDKSGNSITPPIFEAIEKPIEENKYLVSYGKKTGLLNLTSCLPQN